MAKLSIETVKTKVFNNSLKTCECIGGYETTQSIITVRCLKHNHVFNTKYKNVRRDTRPHHICPICQEEDRNKDKIIYVCDYCGKEFFIAPSKLTNTKSGLHFCSRECKDKAQCISSGNKFSAIKPAHYGTTKKDYRKKAFREYEHKCAICGYNEDIDILEVHHIDENRQNNSLENLIILCPICHRKLTTHKYKILNNKIIKLGERDC